MNSVVDHYSDLLSLYQADQASQRDEAISSTSSTSSEKASQNAPSWESLLVVALDITRRPWTRIPQPAEEEEDKTVEEVDHDSRERMANTANNSRGNKSHNVHEDPKRRIFERMVRDLTAVMLVRILAVAAPEGTFSDLCTTTICRTLLYQFRPANLRRSIVSNLTGSAKQNKNIVSELVVEQLERFVRRILGNYRPVDVVPYHSNEHAYHVTLSANKLLDLMLKKQKDDENSETHLAYGLSTDAVALMALMFSALIHDVDHTGISNRQLVLEAENIKGKRSGGHLPMAIQYHDQSVAENWSLYCGFSELLTLELPNDSDNASESPYGALFEAMCPTRDHYHNFRQHVIDIVLNTDIASPERTQLSKSKWKEAGFPDRHTPPSGPADDTSDDGTEEDVRKMAPGEMRRKHLGIRRSMDFSGELLSQYISTPDATKYHTSFAPDPLKAAVVMETIMTAADVGHNLQGWDSMKKWSNRLYLELRRAHVAGHGPDVAKNWYSNQIGFLDMYVLPLAHKLNDIGVFGEIMGPGFARIVHASRDQWVADGEAVTKSIIQEGAQQYPDGRSISIATNHGRCPTGNDALEWEVTKLEKILADTKVKLDKAQKDAAAQNQLVWRILLAIVFLGLFIGNHVDLTSMDSVCSPVSPGKTFLTGDLNGGVHDAPWWAPIAMKDYIFPMLCGSRPRVQMKAQRGKLMMNVDGKDGKAIPYVSAHLVSSKTLVVVDRSGRQQQVVPPWTK